MNMPVQFDITIPGNFTGSYYPFNGCLEDFNTGPVNGNWILSLEDAIQFGDGILRVHLLF